MSWELTTLYKLDIIYSYLDAPIKNLVDVRCGLQLELSFVFKIGASRNHLQCPKDINCFATWYVKKGS